MAPWLENSLLFIVDQLIAVSPQALPDRKSLESCKIVSHRGERDGKTVFENTFAAFDPIVANNIWGIEFDIRWSKDLVPFVIHDEDAKRVFNQDILISSSSAEQIKTSLPLVPTLASFVERYGGKVHLMAELKEEPYPNPSYQSRVLKQIFSSLRPVDDFHFISLSTDMFQYLDFIPSSARLPVSTTNARSFGDYALKHKTGGVTGHYLLVTHAILTQLHQENQKVGTGFINSRKALFREINKGCDWIFSNQAIKIKNIVDESLKVRKH